MKERVKLLEFYKHQAYPENIFQCRYINIGGCGEDFGVFLGQDNKEYKFYFKELYNQAHFNNDINTVIFLMDVEEEIKKL